MEKLKALWTKYKEIITYLIFGVLTTVVSWGSYAIFALLLEKTNLGTTTTVSIANVLSWIFAVAFAYVTNKLWVFESKSWKPSIVWKEIVTFVTARLATGVLEWVGVPFLVGIGMDQTIFGVKGAWAKILVSILVVILNYIFSKLIIFRKKKEPAESKDETVENAEETPDETEEN